jgi:hypothetical protein
MFVVAAFPIQARAQHEKEPRDLSELDRSVVFPSLLKFVQAPQTKSDGQFVQVKKDGKKGFRFDAMPKMWFTWKDTDPEGRMRVLDEDGFRLILHLAVIPRASNDIVDRIQMGHGPSSVVLFDNLFVPKFEQIPRVAFFQPARHAREFSELRYVALRDGRAVRIEISVTSGLWGPKSLDQLLAHLRKHYGKYQGICDQVIQLSQ